ncbi:cell envelope biogenesis protein LolA [Actibacterium mucosum KCTC 23349]|uniref:Cell envelope biogenesis protein LolA n=1 Tax=Actibacterium mucosum KCTC 23349 TaxID=1454373 RepID=A0A037ZN26_9RHOB|nr:outer membrane lipoprotein carrier protein LolA [Actibacterium mucosum]KAJ57479.1 cell envelope biogenesis protein LolA [Actibacterium mucosum KCTC 23349]
MKTLRMTLVALATACTALPAWADKIPLDQISAYFNGFKTAQSDFTQINSDGSLSTGTLYLHRPGRMRFEYDAPNDALVIAGGQKVAIFDNKSNQGPEEYPLRRTPLSIILKRNVNLKQANMVVGHTSDDTSTTVIAQDPEHPEYGSIAMSFTDNPVVLRRWVVTNGAGDQTTVILGDLELGVKLSGFLFNIVFEAEKRLGTND